MLHSWVMQGVGLLGNMETPEKEAPGGDEALYLIVTKSLCSGKETVKNQFGDITDSGLEPQAPSGAGPAWFFIWPSCPMSSTLTRPTQATTDV